MPSDINFEVTEDDVKQGAAISAMTYAVLAPLCPHEMFLRGDRVAMLATVRRLHRHRLTQLAEEFHWEMLANPHRLQTMRNCAPFGVRLVKRAWPCDLYKFCPFCWARLVASPLFTVLAASLGLWRRKLSAAISQDERWLRPYGTKLVEFRYAKRFYYGELKWDTLIAELKKRRAELDSFRWRGAYINETLQSYNKYVLLTRRGLALTDHAPPPAIGDVQVQVHRVFTRKRLALIAGRVAKYPAQLLLEEDDFPLQFFQNTQRVKMQSYYGCFRRHARKN